MQERGTTGEESLERLFALAFDMLCVAGLDGYFKRVNPAFSRVLGHSEEALLAEPFLAFVHEDDRAATLAEMDKLSSGARTLRFENRYRCKDGSYKWLEWSSIPVLEEGRLYAVARDISDRKAMEEERKRLVERLEEIDQLKSHFFANVSHELRTPIALILGLTERLRGQPGMTEAQRRDLDVMVLNGRTLQRHVDDLLDLVKLEAGRMRPCYTRLDVARLVRRTASLFEWSAQDRAISYRVDGAESLEAEVDAEKLSRALSNLLANALRHAPRQGSVTCRFTCADGRLRLEVDNSGIGIPPELRQRIFERFFQAPGDSGQGTGLGLAIVREFIELQGGTVSVLDGARGGSLFRIDLPRFAPAGVTVAPAVDHRSATLPPLPLPTPGDPPMTTPRGDPAADPRPRVLIVEDNAEMNRFLVDALAPTYRVEAALGGAEGLRAAVANPPDLVMTDVMMPELGGDQLVRELRRRKALEDVPIVILTARADDELRLAMLREGAQDYLTKPFSIEEVRARIANLVAIKRARDVLRSEVASSATDLEQLAREVALRKHEAQSAMEAVCVARDYAEHASQVKSSFLRIASHELRGPLTALQLQVQRIQRNPALSEAWADTIEAIARPTGRLVELVETILSYARIESGRLTMKIESLDLASLADDVARELRPAAEKKGLALELEAPPADLPSLRTDRALVRLILVNLIGNAIKYTTRGRIEVALAHHGDEHQLSVRDSGPGIPPALQDRIFEPFVQLDEDTEHKHLPGVGLGLALVRELATSLGGKVELHSEVGVGSAFTVSVPSAEAT